MKFLLGKKIGMTQIFRDDGKVVPATLIEAGPVFVTQLKTKEKDGYSALQIGFEKTTKAKKIKRAQKGKPYRFLREIRASGEQFSGNLKVDQKIDASVFQEGEKVKISGISKGKGFQGAVKKWGFAGQDSTHGTKHEERTIGSIGSRFPQRVLKGKKMPGRMGSERITVKNLEIVKVMPEQNLIAVKGAIPGRRGTLLEIKS